MNFYRFFCARGFFLTPFSLALSQTSLDSDYICWIVICFPCVWKQLFFDFSSSPPLFDAIRRHGSNGNEQIYTQNIHTKWHKANVKQSGPNQLHDLSWFFLVHFYFSFGLRWRYCGRVIEIAATKRNFTPSSSRMNYVRWKQISFVFTTSFRQKVAPFLVFVCQPH